MPLTKRPPEASPQSPYPPLCYPTIEKSVGLLDRDLPKQLFPQDVDRPPTTRLIYTDPGQFIIRAWKHLQLKYTRDKEIIQQTWRELSREAREEMVCQAFGGRDSLPATSIDLKPQFRHYLYLIPEFNLENVVTGDTLLTLLEERSGPIENSHSVDCEKAKEAFENHGVKGKHPPQDSSKVVVFKSEEDWAQIMVFKPEAPKSDHLRALMIGGSRRIISYEIGMLVIERQMGIFPQLGLLVDDIMERRWELDFPGRVETPRTMISSDALVDMKALTVKSAKSRYSKPVMTGSLITQSFEKLKTFANEHCTSMKQNIKLLREDPLYIFKFATLYFYSGLVTIPESSGQISGIQYQIEYATKVMIEMFQDAYEAEAYWKYISILISTLCVSTANYNSRFKYGKKGLMDNVLTRELWAICIEELQRTRKFLECILHHEGGGLFIRNAKDNSITLKMPMKEIAKKNRSLYPLLMLATSDTLSDQESFKLLRSFRENHNSTPKSTRDELANHIKSAVSDISVITLLLLDLRQLIAVPHQHPASFFVRDIKKRQSDLASSGWNNGVIVLDAHAFPISRLAFPKHQEGCVCILDAHACAMRGEEKEHGMQGLFSGTVKASLAGVLAKINDDHLEAINEHFKPLAVAPQEAIMEEGYSGADQKGLYNESHPNDKKMEGKNKQKEKKEEINDQENVNPRAAIAERVARVLVTFQDHPSDVRSDVQTNFYRDLLYP